MIQQKPHELQVKGSCALCGRFKALRRSHYLPAGLFRLLMRADEKPATDLIHVNTKRGIARATSVQPWKYLLCVDCETIFNRRAKGPCCHNSKGQSHVFGFGTTSPLQPIFV